MFFYDPKRETFKDIVEKRENAANLSMVDPPIIWIHFKCHFQKFYVWTGEKLSSGKHLKRKFWVLYQIRASYVVDGDSRC